MRKKGLALIFTAACLVLAACGGSTPVSDAGTSQSLEPENAELQETEEAPGGDLPSDSMETEAFAQNGSLEEEAVEGPVRDGTYEGIVLDAAMNSFSIYTQDGRTVYFGMPENGGSLKNGMLLGNPVRVVCKDGVVTELTDGEKQPASGRAALEFAGSIMTAFRYKDRETLTALIGYPVYVNLDGEEVLADDAEAFEKLDEDKIFSEVRRKAVLTADLYGLKELSGGKYVLGDKSGKPNVTFTVDKGNDRGFSITGIN